jgi:hypothetical protein
MFKNGALFGILYPTNALRAASTVADAALDWKLALL